MNVSSNCVYCFVFRIALRYFYPETPGGKRELPIWQSHVPAHLSAPNCAVSLPLCSTLPLPSATVPRIVSSVKGINLTASRGLGWPSLQMVFYHFLRQTRGHPDTACCSEICCTQSAPHRILPWLPQLSCLLHAYSKVVREKPFILSRLVF